MKQLSGSGVTAAYDWGEDEFDSYKIHSPTKLKSQRRRH